MSGAGVDEKDIKKLRERAASLEEQLTECNGFDCCPLAPKLNAADDRIAEQDAEIAELRTVAIHARMYIDDMAECDGYELEEALTAAGYPSPAQEPQG